MRQKFTTKEKRWCLVPCIKLVNLGKKHISDFQKTRKFLNNFTFFHIDINPFLLAGPLHCNCIFKNKTKQCLKFGKDLFSRVFYKFYFSLRRSGCHPPRVVWSKLVVWTVLVRVWFFGGRRGFYLRSACSCELATQNVAPSAPKPPPTPLHVQSCCALHSFIVVRRANFHLQS